MPILAGDIGGTKTLLQLSRPSAHGLETLYEQRYASTEYPHFTPLIQQFLHDAQVATGQYPSAACLGIAGPVKDRHSVITNLPWQLDADELEHTLHIPRLRLINDFQAIGYGIEALGDKDIEPLQAGAAVQHATRLVVGAGTGLGMGLLVWLGSHYEVVASEGGHSDFAPENEQQLALQQYLKKRYGWATWERVLSGPGLVNLFEFLLESKKVSISPQLQSAMDQSEDIAAVISQFGASNGDAIASEALAIFIQLYGRQTGNLALLGLATGGVYLAGGIAAKLAEQIKAGSFMRAFLDKEARMQPLLENMPVNIISNERVGLCGAALAAARLLEANT